MDYSVANNVITISVDAQVYSEDILFKCFYWYGKSYTINIAKDDTDKVFKVALKPIEFFLTEEVVVELLAKIQQDLIDFKLRDIVTKETKTIRELLVAKAFAYYESDQNPVTDASDPVGFHPETISFYE